MNDRQQSHGSDERQPHERGELAPADFNDLVEIPTYHPSRTTKGTRRSRDEKKRTDRDVWQPVLNDHIGKHQVQERKPSERAIARYHSEVTFAHTHCRNGLSRIPPSASGKRFKRSNPMSRSHQRPNPPPVNSLINPRTPYPR